MRYIATPPTTPTVVSHSPSRRFSESTRDVASYLFSAVPLEMNSMAQSIRTHHMIEQSQATATENQTLSHRLSGPAVPEQLVEERRQTQDDARRLDALRMGRLAASTPRNYFADQDVDMEPDDEQTYWGRDSRFEDDDISWATRHGELYGPVVEMHQPVQGRTAEAPNALSRPSRRLRGSVTDAILDGWEM